MGIINFFKDLFRNKKEDTKITSVELIVNRYMKNKYINFPLLPLFVEKLIYTQVITSVLDKYKDIVNNFTCLLFSHKINFQIIEDDITENIIKNQSTKHMNINKNYINKLIDDYLKSDANISILLPYDIEKQLFQNILLMVQAIFIDTLKTIQINIFDKQIKIKIENKDLNNNTAGYKYNDEDKEIILKLVDTYMNTNNISWIPDNIEKSLYIKCFTIVNYFIKKILLDSDLYFMHKKIKLNIQKQI